MDAAGIALRNRTYGLFVELGRAPTAEELAADMSMVTSEVRDGWRRLHAEHALVLFEESSEIRMANPFSASPTAYRVEAGGRSWYANCAWDAVGIGAALHTDGRIETSCPDCGSKVELDITNQQPSDEALLFHCLVPARSWWDDIGFT